jgi:hypothetical protein
METDRRADVLSQNSLCGEGFVMRKLAFLVAITCSVMLLGGSVLAQERIKLNELPDVGVRIQEEGLGLIDDLHMTSGAMSVVSHTDPNGVKTTKVVDGLKKMTIIEDPASGITCKVTKTYGPEDLSILEKEQPELYMHLTAIPKTIGDNQIEVNVGVTTTYAAADKAELKAKHPDVYKMYTKYTKNALRVGVGGFGIREPLRLRVFPGGAAIDRGDDDDDQADDDDDGDDDDRDDDDGDDDGDGR